MSMRSTLLTAKVLFVIEVILEERQLASDEEELEISLETFLKEQIVTQDELLKIIDLLREEKCLNLEKTDRYSQIDHGFLVDKRKVILIFPLYTEILQKRRSLLLSGAKIGKTYNEKSKGKLIYNLRRDEITCKIFLNDQEVASPTPGSVQDRFAELIMDEFNECPLVLSSHTLREFQVACKTKKTIPMIITHLKFSDQMRKIFFPSISNEKLIFTPRIYEDDMRTRNLPRVIR